MKTTNINQLKEAFKQCWSLKSSTKWKIDNPALGQCGVTAMVANDFLGGEILKTKVTKPGLEIWHYYNRIKGTPIDFTDSQFDDPITYHHTDSTHTEAFGDTNHAQYKYLNSAVKRYLNNTR